MTPNERMIVLRDRFASNSAAYQRISENFVEVAKAFRDMGDEMNAESCTNHAAVASIEADTNRRISATFGAKVTSNG